MSTNCILSMVMEHLAHDVMLSIAMQSTCLLAPRKIAEIATVR